MGNVIEFPDRPGAADVAQAVGGYDNDVGHVVEAIRGALPQEALDQISSEEMTLAAARAIARLYEVRVIREVAQEQAREAARAACEAAAVGEGAQPNPRRGEYDALKEMIEGRDPLNEPPGPAVA